MSDPPPVISPPSVLPILASSRSHLQEAVKTKKWDDRMQKTKKAQAIKMLHDELKEEKQAEWTRSDLLLAPSAASR